MEKMEIKSPEQNTGEHVPGGMEEMETVYRIGEILSSSSSEESEQGDQERVINTGIETLLKKGEFSEWSSPHRVVLVLERRCNMRCSHCYWSHDIPKDDNKSAEVDWSEKIDQLVDLGSEITYAGRILTPQSADFLREYCRRSGREIGIVDNGYTILLPKFRDLLDHCGVINISLDGVPEDHDRQRNQPGSFNVALECLRKLRDEWFAETDEAGHAVRNKDGLYVPRKGRQLAISSCFSPINIGRWEEFEDIVCEKEALPLVTTPVLGVRSNKQRSMPLFGKEDFPQAFMKVMNGRPKLVNLYDPEHMEIMMPFLKTLNWEINRDGVQLMAKYKPEGKGYTNKTVISYRPMCVENLNEIAMMWDGNFYAPFESADENLSHPLNLETDRSKSYLIELSNGYAKREQRILQELLDK